MSGPLVPRASPLGPCPTPLAPRAPALAEVLLVFAVFCLQGAAPTPGINEPYYLGKAIHYWNPDWAAGDFFLESKDAHGVFYYTFGWLSLWLAPPALAWTGRILTWGLLAWAWSRLGAAVLPGRCSSVLSAALLVCLVERCHMAGEWIVGGVEAKGFAFVLVLLGIEAVVRRRWNRAWLLLGAASAFHVLVGGWSVVAAGLAWLMSGRDRPALWSMLPAMFGGLLLSLPGLIPAMTLNWGTDPETVRVANGLYVYERLRHHLDPGQMPVFFVRRFVLLGVLWLLLCASTPAEVAGRRFRAFVAAAVAIALAGAAIHGLSFYAEDLGARLLRLYWFRLADVVVPAGVAVEGVRFAMARLRTRPILGRSALAVAVVVAGVHVGVHLVGLLTMTIPPGYRMSERVEDFEAWRDACTWVAQSGRIPPDAVFLTPPTSQTFKWYARRAEVANSKEIPQDAEAIVQWWQRTADLSRAMPRRSWDPRLADLGAQWLNLVGRRYGAEYAIAVAEPRLSLEVVYCNDRYVVYRLGEG